jgi:transposase InsO family protein
LRSPDARGNVRSSWLRAIFDGNRLYLDHQVRMRQSADLDSRACRETDAEIVVANIDMSEKLSFRLLYGLLVMSLGRRQILWVGVTAHPTAEWIANQLTEACGWEQVPRHLMRDRDACYGNVFIRRVYSLGIRDHPTSPRSPWQNGYAERLIGSIRRECLDHIVVFGERHLHHILMSYMGYYNAVRTHLSLSKDAPVQRRIYSAGRVEVRPLLGGLHHQYVRI